MDEQLKSVLSPGEELVWSGRAESFKLLDEEHKGPFIKKAAILLAVWLVITVVYAIMCADNFKVGIPVILLLLAAVSAVSDLNAARKTGKLGYALTDKRLLVYGENNQKIKYSEIADYRFVDDNGNPCLLIGSEAINTKQLKWRTLPSFPSVIDDGSGKCTRGALYSIPDFENFKKLFEEKIK